MINVAGTPHGKKWHLAVRPEVGLGPTTTLCGLSGAYVSNLTKEQSGDPDQQCQRCWQKAEEPA